MADTPTMSLRVPHNAEMRKALREAAKAMRQGQVSAEALLAWLASRLSTDHGLTERVEAIEGRLAALETAMERQHPAQTHTLFRHAAKGD
ncbi:hypothetical protein [Azospirillum sp. sgz301742]